MAVAKPLVPAASAVLAIMLALASAVLAIMLALATVFAVLALAATPAWAADPAPPTLNARAAALIELNTGQELYGLNAGAELPIASTTKLMTALVTLEHAPLGTMFTDPTYYPAAVDSQIGLTPGERMSVSDLLLAMLLPSADDAAEDLAYNVGHGSVANFIAMMNARAGELGLSHTHYSTPIGLDTPGNYSSALDLTALARELLLTQPFFKSAVAQPSAVLRTGDHVRVAENLDDLVGRVPWINGVKTGHTLDAGYVLVGSGTRDGMTLIGAVLGTSSESERDANMLALLDWGFQNFQKQTPVVAGSVLARPKVRGRPGIRATVVAARSFTRVLPQQTPLSTRVELPRQLGGPLRRGTVVGSMLVLAGSQAIARVPLVLARAVPAPDVTLLAGRLTRPFTLVLLVLLIGAVIALNRFRRERMRERRAAGSRPAAPSKPA